MVARSIHHHLYISSVRVIVVLCPTTGEKILTTFCWSNVTHFRDSISCVACLVCKRNMFATKKWCAARYTHLSERVAWNILSTRLALVTWTLIWTETWQWLFHATTKRKQTHSIHNTIYKNMSNIGQYNFDSLSRYTFVIMMLIWLEFLGVKDLPHRIS